VNFNMNWQNILKKGSEDAVDRLRFIEVYKATRKEQTITLDQLKKKYQL